MPVSSAEVTFRPFRPDDESAFRTLNETWIRRHFKLESKDLASFDNPKERMIDAGGHILFAVKNEEIIGCCALVAMGTNQFEVAKMAVSDPHQGSGVGRRLLEKTIATARALGAARLYLETNHVLVPVIQLYESLGFRHLPKERVTPSPYDRADVYMELDLKV